MDQVFVQAHDIEEFIHQLQIIQNEYGNVPLATMTSRGVDVIHGAICHIHDIKTTNDIKPHLIVGIDPLDAE